MTAAGSKITMSIDIAFQISYENGLFSYQIVKGQSSSINKELKEVENYQSKYYCFRFFLYTNKRNHLYLHILCFEVKHS